MMKTTPLIATLALVVTTSLQAEPLWAGRVDASQLDERSQQIWTHAIESWDIFDQTQAIDELQSVAERNPDEPELWLALAAAAEEAANTSDRELALSRLMTAQTALSRLSLTEVDTIAQVRANLLSRSVEQQYNEVSQQLADLRTNPPALVTLGGGLEPGLEANPTRSSNSGEVSTRAVRVNAGTTLVQSGGLNGSVSFGVN